MLLGLIDLRDDSNVYWLSAAAMLGVLFGLRRLINSPFGMMLIAIRDNERRALSLGHNVDAYKLAAFGIAAFCAGVAGAMSAIVFQLATLSGVHWHLSGEAVLMALIGGIGTFGGPLVGAACAGDDAAFPVAVRCLDRGNPGSRVCSLRPAVSRRAIAPCPCTRRKPSPARCNVENRRDPAGDGGCPMNDVSGTQRLALVSNSTRLNELSARTIVSAIRDRRLTAISVMEACLERIAVREPQVKAWSFLDADLARERARLADKWQAAGYPIGRLHGLPVGVKGCVRYQRHAVRVRQRKLAWAQAN
jgi:hypothetical protein